MKIFAVFAIAMLGLFVPAARADQFEYLTLRQAQDALAKLHRGDVVHMFCAPCGEVASQRMTVRSVGVDRVWDRARASRVYRDTDGASFWVVEVNDEDIDLAYVYVRDGRRWRNLAQWLGLAPIDVPIELPRSVIGRRWRCGDRNDNPYWTIFNQRRDPCPIDAAAYEAAGRAQPGWH